MTATLRRRQFLLSAAGLASGACASTHGTGAPRAGPIADESWARLERARVGRLGVVVMSVASGRQTHWRGDERFPMASTFKTLLAAAVLARVDAGGCALDELVRFGPADVLEYAPVVKANLARGAMTIAALGEAAVTVSDNMAANLLLARIGGPGAVTAFARSLGDQVTRLDRIEPAVNDVASGDERDTTSPRAMAGTLRRLFLGDALAPASRARLLAWHRATSTGPGRLRAGLPSGWTFAHKTGTGERGVVNDIGIAWSPAGDPVIIAAYCVAPASPVAETERNLAEVGRLAAFL